ncbi:MAG TPA: oxidoreductase [Spirochaetaceae bacterium]|jgi:DMSO/TMAO reductase YedYZ molybdopterin-dependent catalytic subunit|nr:oxidoreductase [Spirochaetaceae bacterium]
MIRPRLCGKRRAAFIAALALASIMALGSCGRASDREPAALTSPSWTVEMLNLEPAEIAEYRGEKLTPRASLRDNSIAGPQYPDYGSYRLVISGLVERRLSLSYEEVLAFQKAEKLITLNCVEGWNAIMLWTGTLLSGLLDAAGADPAADTLIFVCLDGYETTMETSHARERNILLAWATNGLPLGPENGAPFQIAAEEKWGYKWAKWVREIRVLREPGYQGYWEKRGFSVSGFIGERYSAPIEERDDPKLQ